MMGSVSVRPRTPTVVAVHSLGRAGAAAPGLGPPGHCDGAAAPPPSTFLCHYRSAPLRVVVGEHCRPKEGSVSVRPRTPTVVAVGVAASARRGCCNISKLLYAYFLRIMRIFLFTQKIRSSVVCVNKTRSRIFCVFSAYFLRISCVQNDISAYIMRIFCLFSA